MKTEQKEGPIYVWVQRVVLICYFVLDAPGSSHLLLCFWCLDDFSMKGCVCAH